MPIEDSTKVVQYVIDNYEEFSIDPSQVFLCGDSAGIEELLLVVKETNRILYNRWQYSSRCRTEITP